MWGRGGWRGGEEMRGGRRSDSFNGLLSSLHHGALTRQDVRSPLTAPRRRSAAIVGDRFSKKCSTKTKKMTQDEEDEGLNLSLKNNKVIEEMNMWNSLGDECNEAAIGVDVFGILES